MNPSNKTAAYKLAYHQRQDNIPVIYVKMESLKQNMSYLENMSNVIPFFMDADKFSSIKHNCITYVRK